MKFKLVFSEVPACSQGHTSNDTLSCLGCGMMHVGSKMKLYVPEDQPVPKTTEVSATTLKIGEQATIKVNFTADVKQEELEVFVASGLKLISANMSGKVATVVVEADQPFYGTRVVMVGHKGVRRMFDLKIVKPEPAPAPVPPVVNVSNVQLSKETAEVGDVVTVTVTFSNEVVDGVLPSIEVTPNLKVTKPFALSDVKTTGTAEVTCQNEGSETVTVKYGEQNLQKPLTVTAKVGPVA